MPIISIIVIIDEVASIGMFFQRSLWPMPLAPSKQPMSDVD